jgi:putative membrane protein
MIDIILFILQIIGALLLGILFGIFTGLIPGIHVNTLGVLIVALSVYIIEYIDPIILACFIAAISITHTFLDFIPGIFLGSPDEDTALSILPGHSMLLEGKAHHAVKYTLYGSLLGLIIVLLLSPVFIWLLPHFYIYIKYAMFYILILASIYLLLREKEKTLSFLVFLLAGILGISTFSLNIQESLLPMLTGLFGSSSLILSMLKKQKIPKQDTKNFKSDIKKSSWIKIFFATTFASSICSFLPGLGSGQAAVFASDIAKENKKHEFLALLGSINTIVMGLSILALYSLDITRTGSAVSISQILEEFPLYYIFILLGVILASGIASFFLGSFLSRFISKKITKLNYKYLSLVVLSLLAIFVLVFSGPFGFLIFLVSTSLGIYTILAGARRTLLMGCLMLPVIIFYLPF